MKCKKHNSEMTKGSKSAGWCSETEWFCPQCAAEKVQAAIKRLSGQTEPDREIARHGR